MNKHADDHVFSFNPNRETDQFIDYTIKKNIIFIQEKNKKFADIYRKKINNS